MISLSLLVIVAIWLPVAWWLAKIITLKLPDRWWHTLIRTLLLIVLLPLPLADEIVAALQFQQLCKLNLTIQVDRESAKGKTVYLDDQAASEIEGAWVRIVMKPWRYVDAISSKPVVTYYTVQASGGRLVQAIGITKDRVPLIFKGTCEPGGAADSQKLFQELGITQIQRKETDQGPSRRSGSN